MIGRVLQAALGWTNSHLYELRAGDVGWGIPDPDDGDGPLDARKARLGKILDRVEDRACSPCSATGGLQSERNC